jgi:hypothetical protein
MPSVLFVRLSLLLAVAMLMAGGGLQPTLLSIRAGIEDFSIVATGLVIASMRHETQYTSRQENSEGPLLRVHQPEDGRRAPKR